MQLLPSLTMQILLPGDRSTLSLQLIKPTLLPLGQSCTPPKRPQAAPRRPRRAACGPVEAALTKVEVRDGHSGDPTLQKTRQAHRITGPFSVKGIAAAVEAHAQHVSLPPFPHAGKECTQAGDGAAGSWGGFDKEPGASFPPPCGELWCRLDGECHAQLVFC